MLISLEILFSLRPSSLLWWTPWLFCVLGRCLAAWWRSLWSVWFHRSLHWQTERFCRLLSLFSCSIMCDIINEDQWACSRRSHAAEPWHHLHFVSQISLCVWHPEQMLPVSSRYTFHHFGKIHLRLTGPWNFVPELLSLVSVLFGKFQCGPFVLIANEWFPSSGVASVLLFLKSPVTLNCGSPIPSFWWCHWQLF